MGNQLPLPSYISTLNTLHSRIAVLETELAQALSDKIAAEHATQYVLRHIATDQYGSTSRTSHEELLRLEHEVRTVNSENANLRIQLCKAILVQEEVVRRQKAKCSSNIEPVISTSSLHEVSAVLSSSTGTSPTFTNLMDLEDVPNLDFSTGSSSSSDDLEQLSTYVQAAPQIDLVTKEQATFSKDAVSEEIVSPCVRRFVKQSFDSAATLASQDHPSHHDQVLPSK